MNFAPRSIAMASSREEVEPVWFEGTGTSIGQGAVPGATVRACAIACCRAVTAASRPALLSATRARACSSRASGMAGAIAHPRTNHIDTPPPAGIFRTRPSPAPAGTG